MSTLSDRDRKALTLGGGGVALIVLFHYIVAPLWQRWDETGDRLESRRAFIASFRERVETRESLRTRRDVLALRIGSLRVLHPKVEEEKKPENGSDEGEGGHPAPTEDGGAPDGETEAPKAEAGQPTTENSAEEGGETDDTVAGKEGREPQDSPETPADSESGNGAKPELPPIVPPGAGEGDDPTAKQNLAKRSEEEDGAPESGGVETSTEEQTAGLVSPETEAEEKEAEKTAAKKARPEKDKDDKPKKPERAAVPSIEASSLSAYVEKNAKAAKIKLKRITPKKNTTGKRRTKYFEPVTIQVNFECQITNLVQLLHDLEKGELFVRVDKVEITRNVEQGDKLNASLELSSYEPLEETT